MAKLLDVAIVAKLYDFVIVAILSDVTVMSIPVTSRVAVIIYVIS